MHRTSDCNDNTEFSITISKGDVISIDGEEKGVFKGTTDTGLVILEQGFEKERIGEAKLRRMVNDADRVLVEKYTPNS